MLTCRTPDGLGSGWAGITGVKDLSMIDPRGVTSEASQKAVMSRTARAIEPGRYTVILEPRANARFLSLTTGAIAGGGGGGGAGGALGDVRVGDKVFSDLFTLRSDIGNPILSYIATMGAGALGLYSHDLMAQLIADSPNGRVTDSRFRGLSDVALL